MRLRFICLTAIFPILGLTPPLAATPLETGVVPAAAQWVLHLDMDRFRKTRSGQAFIRELRDKTADPESRELPIDPITVVNGLRGLTYYGTSLELSGGDVYAQGGVVYLEGSPAFVQVVQGLIAGMELEVPECARVIEEHGDLPIYAIDGDIFGVILDEKHIAVGRSLPGIRDFLAVRKGHRPAANSHGRWEDGRRSGGTFLTAFADGINRIGGLPAQARVLQLAEGISLRVGESGEQLSFQASLVTDSPRTARQIQQVLQGIVALLSLAQNLDPDLDMLVRSARFSQDDQRVHCEGVYPVESALDWIARLAEMSETAWRPSESHSHPPPRVN